MTKLSTTVRQCLRIIISTHTLIYSIRSFSPEVFLCYFILALTYDILNHFLFSEPDGRYVTCDGLISLVWILTFHLSEGDLINTIIALQLSNTIWWWMAALRTRVGTRRGEKEARDGEFRADSLDKAAESKKIPGMYEVDPAGTEAGKEEESWDIAWERVNREALDEVRAAKSRIEEIESQIEEHIGNWVP